MILEIEKNGKKKAQTKKVSSDGAKASKPKIQIALDFPKEGDRIDPRHYAVRVSAAGGTAVEISIDGAAWKPSRQSAGHYWFDWTNIPAGEHKLAARLKTSDGKYKKSKITKCEVK